MGRAARRQRRAGRASRRHGARRARGGLSAPRLRRTEEAGAQGRRGDRARRTPHHDDAGREDRRRSARGAGRRRRPAFAGVRAVGGGAPAGAPRRQLAGAGRARGEGDRCRDQRAGGGRPASQRGADRGRFRSRRARAHRGAAVRAARRLAQIFDAGRWARRARREIRRRRRADRCRRRAVEEAGGGGRRSRQALRCGRHQALRRARQNPRRSSTRPSMPNWRR